ncbi:forkhead box protein N1 [Pelodytes ibericus]
MELTSCLEQRCCWQTGGKDGADKLFGDKASNVEHVEIGGPRTFFCTSALWFLVAPLPQQNLLGVNFKAEPPVSQKKDDFLGQVDKSPYLKPANQFLRIRESRTRIASVTFNLSDSGHSRWSHLTCGILCSLLQRDPQYSSSQGATIIGLMRTMCRSFQVEQRLRMQPIIWRRSMTGSARLLTTDACSSRMEHTSVFLPNQDLASSIMQDPSNMKFSSGSLDNECSPINQSDDGILDQTGSSCLQMDTVSYGGQSHDSESQADRKSTDSSMSPMSPNLSSSPQDHMHVRFPIKTSPSEEYRRYSCDDSTERNYNKYMKSRNQYHPYKRQFSDVFPDTLHSLPLRQKTFKNMDGIEGFEEVCGPSGPEDSEAFATHDISAETTWCNSLQYNSTQEEGSHIMLGSEVKLKPTSLVMRQQEKEQRMYWSQSPTQQIYCTPQTFPQYPTGGSYPVTYISTSHYPYQRIAPQAALESQQPLYPKPIYSYSILIFMALKNSKTGSLPVSEIYNFMTEHFPYFKTAPDGWKNSVRHNLSLNKCFEKVENKSGSSSRKGCLWALNPAKIDKMQEELQKWKRKDPVTVRKSMAKPEDLDKLIGERTEKLRSALMACNSVGLVNTPVAMQMSMQTAMCEPSISPSVPTSLQSVHDVSASLHAKKQLAGHQPPCYTSLPHGYPQISPAMIQQHHSIPQNHYSTSDNQNELRAQPLNPQDSPIPAHTPPLHNMKVLTDHSPARTMQDNLNEGELSNDIDALNPSLTDFELQGNLWEELKDDSLAMDPLNLISSSLTPPPPQYYLHNGNCVGTNNEMSSPSSSSHMGFGDIHLTTVYSSFMELDTAMPSYINTSGSKHVAIV